MRKREILVLIALCMFGASLPTEILSRAAYAADTSASKSNSVYVKKEVESKPQEVVKPEDLKIPSGIKLVDSNATKATSGLYAYLMGIGKTYDVLYGHQNDTHKKAALKDSGSNSDTKDVTGSISAICGIDASFQAAEVHYTDQDKQNGIDEVTKGADLAIDTAKQGGIISVSAHMPNFELVKEKGKDADGKYDYLEYSSNVTTGNIVQRIMPGGDLNDVYIGYLDRVAEFAHKLDAAGVPVLFRPFHENNGSWFWWGKGFCDEEAYKNLYRYTVQYLRDTENVHNFLYVYSPGGSFEGEDDYLSRYPGDEFVDVLGFDMYDSSPTADASTDPWMKSFEETVKLVSGIADKKGKLSAVSEVGINNMPLNGNADKDWFQEISDIISPTSMSYYMVWSNEDTKSFFAPFMVNKTEGHEMINNFIKYYNNENSVFADGVGNYSSINANVEAPYSYGFITSPVSGNRILKPTQITASVKGYTGKVTFVLKNKQGQTIQTLEGKLSNGAYSAKIDQETLNKMGETLGTLELYCDSRLLDTADMLYNVPEPLSDPKSVDNFESYAGEDSLLQREWTTNAGSGCSVSPELSNVKSNLNSGKYGLEFKYKISTEKASEGWAGVTKSLGVDWSDCNALQFWCKPDGKAQKLVIQITSNGEAFEVHLPEFAGTTEPKLITLPFSQFVGKNNGVFNPAKIDGFGIWCNTIVPSGTTGTWTVDSSMYFDDIKAVKVNN
ncbi:MULTISPECIES: glycosyl hydrolase [unclassified Clostridium]|uniref:glycosyl hydrolase n=1 Tax=unclassified Clostridium TaxID=2614128 RepID=UPI000297C62E|nr:MULTISPECIES: glycosyl hydrolase [unclassified Clostridium]EKQ56617.1 MAG: beta-mannanase [Clostridium sp. Maddingley MBC34-26]